jgi:photosystem II stability/assembly factor-like uncharacterized protein
VQGNSLTGAARFAISADGNTLLAACGGVISISTNQGATWATTLQTNGAFGAVACSADGRRMTVGQYDPNVSSSPSTIYESSDFGKTWTNVLVSGASLNEGPSIASSADGKTLLVHNLEMDYANPIYLSHDAGVTWSDISTKIQGSRAGVKCSSDGLRLLVDLYRGYASVSTDGGATWSVSASTGDWSGNMSGFAQSSADACVLLGFDTYSYPQTTVFISRVPPTPNLKLSVSGNGAALSWPVPSTDFVLQQSTTLDPANWGAVAATPALNLTNLQCQVLLPLGASNNFYRLSTGN